MTGTIRDSWTRAVTFIEMYSEENCLSCGSGFFWKGGERTLLVTNWHNLAGRNPETQQPMSPQAAIPTRVRFLIYKRVAAPDESGKLMLIVDAASVPLYEREFERALWLEHPTHHRAVDVAAIDVTDALREAAAHYHWANELEGDAEVQPHAPEDAYVIGYPLALATGSPVPVWKRASIATEPSIDAGGLPRIFVDTATREGMSGSLVLVRHLLLGPYRKRDGSQTNNLICFVNRILGIYSGRLGDDAMKAQLGIVWKRYLIDEVVTAGCPGQIGIA